MEPKIFKVDPGFSYLVLWLERMEVVVALIAETPGEEWRSGSQNPPSYTAVVGLLIVRPEIFPTSVKARVFLRMRCHLSLLTLRLLALSLRMRSFLSKGFSA